MKPRGPSCATIPRTQAPVVAYSPTCIFCLTFSVGTRIKHALASPIEAAAMWIAGESIASLPLPVRAASSAFAVS